MPSLFGALSSKVPVKDPQAGGLLIAKGVGAYPYWPRPLSMVETVWMAIFRSILNHESGRLSASE